MSFVRSFEDFSPPKRFDEVPFTQAVIEEAAAEDGPYAAIETIELDPLDTDPSDPQARSFTTALAEEDPGWYRITWKDANGAQFVSDTIYLTSPSATYATPGELREKLGVTAEMLSDSEAAKIITEAEDLIDERLGVRPIDEDTGRKVVPADEDGWRVDKLRDATLEIAGVIFSDPGVVSRQRARFASGDVSVSGFYGPAFGERSEALLNQSGLRVNRARMSGSGRRRYRRACEPQ